MKQLIFILALLPFTALADVSVTVTIGQNAAFSLNLTGNEPPADLVLYVPPHTFDVVTNRQTIPDIGVNNDNILANRITIANVSLPATMSGDIDGATNNVVTEFRIGFGGREITLTRSADGLRFTGVIPSAIAVPQLTFTAGATTGVGEVVPVLTWNATPAPQLCIASGGWSGPRPASGTETLPAINQAQSFSLECTWPGPGGQFVATWIPATTNENGTPYTNPAAVIVRYRKDAETTITEVRVPHPQTTQTVTGLAPGTYTVTAQSINTSNERSADSPALTKVVTLQDTVLSEVIGITVDPRPLPPSGFSVE